MPNFPLRDKVDEAEGGFAGEVDESAQLQDDKKGRRFLHAIITAGCIYFLLRFASQHFLFHDLFTSWGTHHASEEQFLPDNCLQESDWSLPRVQLPVDPMAPRFSAVDTFESFATLNIPIDSADRHLTTLVFISQHWPGTFRVITSPYQANDSIAFNVSAKYQAPEFLSSNLVNVCAPSSRRYAKGFMIFSRAPRAVANLKHLGKFDTTLILPEPTKSNSEPLLFSELQSYAAHTDHFIADVGSKVRFKSVFLKSRKSIEVESLSADRIEISSLGGPIRGTFNTTTGLALTTANSPILVNVNINNTGTFQSQTPYFTATTSNSPLAFLQKCSSIVFCIRTLNE